MQKKYTLTPAPDAPITGLFRLQAIRSFGRVKAGDLGGYVEHEGNLSHEGNCWTFENSAVTGNARVLEDAQVQLGADISGRVTIAGKALVSGAILLHGDIAIGGVAVVRRADPGGAIRKTAKLPDGIREP